MSTNGYNGDYPVVHQVRRGESLSLIASAYGFKRWEPVWVYNTKVHQILGADPNLVRAGTKVILPRSPRGYEQLIRKLRALKDVVAGQGDKIRYELEGDNFRHQGARVMWDFAGDVATLVGTVAFKAANAARSARAAASASGQAKVAAQYLADKQARQLTQGLLETLGDKAINALLTSQDEDLGRAHKDLYVTQRDGFRAIRNVSLQGGRSLLDISEILLDYVTVSKVADGMIFLMVGETPGMTYKRAQQTINRSVTNSRMQLDKKIQKYRRERELLYGRGG